MIRYSMRTKQTEIIREPDETALSRNALIERKTGVVDGRTLPPDEWSVLVISIFDLVDLVAASKS